MPALPKRQKQTESHDDPENEGEHNALLETPLPGDRRGMKTLGSSTAGNGGAAKSFSGTLRWAILVGILAVVAVYHLGMDAESAGEESNPEDKGSKQHWKISWPKAKSSSGGSFTREKLAATRKAGQDLLDLLEEYYFGKNQTVRMLMESWREPWDFNIPADVDATASRERADKLVDTMARALVTDEQEEFLMGAIGSSVAAGHDNCHYDSYESQMERTFGPVWEAAGMKFVFQNAGEGGGCGDSFANQIFCIKQNVSPNVDIVHYEWTFFEHGGGHAEQESLVRWTQMLPRQPPVHVFDVGGLKTSLEKTNTHKLYAKYGYNSFYQRTGFKNGGYDYEGEQNREKDPINRFGWGYHGDGYHNTTRYGEVCDDPARKYSLGVVMRNWHPGPMGFQLTSDAFSYVYTKAILKALDLIEKELDEGNDPRDIWSASKRPILMKNDLPEPLYCNPEYCIVDEAPGCLNYEKPTFGVWGPRVEDPDDDLNPHQGELQNWTVYQEQNGLFYMLGKEDTAVFKNRDDKEMCRHLDACGGISAQSKENGMVVFRLPKMEVGLVIICAYGGKNIAEAKFLNNADIEIRYNTVVIDRKTWVKYPNGKCVRLLERFPTKGRMAETPSGHAYLSIKVVKDMNEPLRISHVITL